MSKVKKSVVLVRKACGSPVKRTVEAEALLAPCGTEHLKKFMIENRTFICRFDSPAAFEM